MVGRSKLYGEKTKSNSCAVLNDGTRILTNTAIFQAFDRPRKGKPSEEYRLKNVPAFITANNYDKNTIMLQLKDIVKQYKTGDTNVEALKGVEIAAPVKIGDIVLADIAGTGVNVVAARNISAL